MKQTIIFFISILLLSMVLLTFQHCGSDGEEPEPNKPPTVSITSPTDNAVITIGETVQISVSATDPDGSISKVTIYINNVEEDSFNAPPYSLSVNTADADAGQYTIKAVAEDNLGLTATDQITVSLAENNPPTVTTSDITDITETTASGGGNVTDDGGNDISARGVVWGETSGPTLESNSGKTEDGSGTGAFTSNLTGLTPNTTYYVKAYATNSQGTAYGEEKSFKTTGSLPTVVTGSVTDITYESANCNGEVTDDGGEAVSARGLVWSLYSSAEPTLEENLGLTDEGAGNGGFTSAMTSLDPNTQYQVRAYATNSAGTTYGEIKYFWTLEGPIGILTTDITEIDAHVAIGGGTVTDFGGADVLMGVGVIWGTEPNPAINGNYVDIYQDPAFSTSDENPFSVPIFSLEPETTYYVRAFGVNSTGTYYGDQKTFTTTAFSVQTGSFTDARDGKTYNTVTIVSQTWMAENLAYLPEVCASDADCGYWVYDYQGTDPAAAEATTNYDTYGVLYNWEMASQACPVGWHLPSWDDWTILEVSLGMSYWASTSGLTNPGTDEGGKLKESGPSHWDDPNTGATNTSGFTALPGGVKSTTGTFESLGSNATFWTSSGGPTDYNTRSVYSNDARIGHGFLWGIQGFSVRCVQD